MNATKVFRNILQQNREGQQKGIYSVCSANSDVLSAAFKQAEEDSSLILIESTCNQVNQYGGYTGMKPSDFVNFVYALAEKMNFPQSKILLGGDHLGPNPWRDKAADVALAESRTLIRDYVLAGYRKIHLDTSMSCADDEQKYGKVLPDEVIAKRAAELCQVAEETLQEIGGEFDEPVYIIGTEVPVPGGAVEESDGIIPTTPVAAEDTISITKKAFYEKGLEKAWERVVGVVVQPGVEFNDDQVFSYEREKAGELSNKILEFDNFIYEAHSTDFQKEKVLSELVQDHFCILKVGPWLTYAYREALFDLEAIEIELLGRGNLRLSNLKNTIDGVMLDDPRYWKDYYHGDDYLKSFKRKYSFSDRLRYYWPTDEVEKAKRRLMRNLSKVEIPDSLVSQFFPVLYYENNGELKNTPESLLHNYIQVVLKKYSRACGNS